VNLLDLTLAEAARVLGEWLGGRGEPVYRLKQIVPRLWRRPVAAWRDASDLPTRLAAALDEAFPLPRLTCATRQTSRDGTVKFLWRLADAQAIESVLIPEGRRRTLCLSSQAGCAYGCVFCATGLMGLQRHLAPWEIAGQVRELVLDQGGPGRPTNVVFMGMGEPLHNWEAVDRALSILNHPDGCGIGARHITVSTVGILPNLKRLGERPEQFRLAISLHAPTSAKRRALMPVERKYGLDDLMRGLGGFARRVTFEYVMIRGMNDSPDDARALAALARPLGAHVNLLPLHPGGAPGFESTAPRDIRAFAAAVKQRGVAVSVRRSRGLDIAAACGQLRVATERARGVRSQQHAHVE
jgi:23S rRNA (adenine2503-C2)-methyltransferase